ncbi:MAG: insulinase family protein [Spirobacillus cienkowskii]|uniref:Insulinase family protein n=1 Tax=Spirobacillus cienkowskii TaxID=495820 RepID=A0A369KTL3_9BACT|nr:MAG: insulinase family protein [Spirobacillus cienkowskii]
MYNIKNPIIHRFLPNGMEVYLQPSDFAPIVSIQVLVKVGSIDEEAEPYKENGLAHVLEHMLFKGTKKFPNSGQIASIVEFEGGDINAYTTFDHTNYHLTAPAPFALKGAEVLLDVVQNSLLEQEELKKELEVIIEEIKRSRDNPNAVVSHNLFSLFYNGTRMASPVIGYQDIVQNFTREQVYSFYKKWYLPNNMIFVATGDFNSQTMYDHLVELSKEFTPHSVPKRFRAPLPETTLQTPTAKIERGAWQEARLQIATPAPVLEEHDMPLWDVFASILGESDTSRLTRILRDELQLVTSIDCSCYTPKYPCGLLGIGFFARAHNTLSAIKIIAQEIRRIAEVPPTRDELNRVLNTLKAQRIYSRESMDGIARSAGMSLQTSLKMEFENMYMSSVSQVTPEHVQNIAKKVLSQLESGQFQISLAIAKDALPDISEAILIETLFDAIKMAQHSEVPKDHQIQKRSTTNTAEENWLSSYTHHVSHSNNAVKQIKIELPLGKVLKINFRKSSRLPIVSGMLLLKGGYVREPKEKNGVSGLMASMLTRGTQRQTYRKFIEELEDNASSISAFSSRDLFGMRFDSISENSLRTAQMLLDCFFRPEFSQSEWQRTHKETLEVLIAQKDSPTARLARISQPLLFPNHSYSFIGIGNEQSLNNIQKNDALDIWKQLFTATEFVFSIAGDFDLKSFVHLIESEFKTFFLSDYQEKTLTQPTAPLFPKFNDPQVGFDEIEREQAHITVSFRSFSISDHRRTALELAANILAGQGGRLFLDLRDKRSLAYSVSASQSPNVLAGVFTAYIATTYHKAQEAIEGLKFHIEKLAQEPPSIEELKRAQHSVLGSQSIESQHHNYQASQLAMSDVYGLDFDNFLRFSERVNAVTAEQVSEVLQSLLIENIPIISVVGPKGTWIPDKHDPMLKWNLKNI